MPDDLTTRINALPPEFEAVREWQHELRTAAAVYIFGLETKLAAAREEARKWEFVARDIARGDLYIGSEEKLQGAFARYQPEKEASDG